MNENKWILKKGLSLTILSIIIAVFSFAKEALFANYFGTTEVADAYTVAIQIPEILFAVVWEAINAIVIPVCTDIQIKEGKERANSFLSKFATFILLGTTIFVVLAEILSHPLIYMFSPGLGDYSHNLAVDLMRWILPILFFEGVARISTAVLNIYGKFSIPKVINGIRNVSVIIFLLIFANQFGVFAAVYGFLFGLIMESAISLLWLRKYERIHFDLDLQDQNIRKAWYMAVPISLGVGANQINQIADKVIASFLVVGSISSLNYGSKMSSIIQTLLLTNIVTLMYPSFSKLAVRNEKVDLTKLFLKSINLSVFICVPLIFGGYFLRNEIIFLAFQRGSFGYDSTLIVGAIFFTYLLGCMFSSIRQIAVKLFTAFCDTKTPMINSAVGVCVNIILDIIFAKAFGVVGLALATTISTGIVCIIMLRSVKKLLTDIDYKPAISFFIKATISGITMLIILSVLKESLHITTVNYEFIETLAYFVIAFIVAVVIYFVLLYVFRSLDVRGKV